MYTLVDMLQCRGRAALRVKAEKVTAAGWGVVPIYVYINIHTRYILLFMAQTSVG